MDTQTSSTGDRAMSQQGNTADSTNFTKPPPLESGSAGERQLNNILALSPSLSLTLDDKFLAISGIDKTATKSAKRDHRSCGIGVPVRGRSKKSIDYYNVLWAEVTEDRRHLRIDYAEQTHEHYLEPQNLSFSLSHLASEEANDTSLAGVTSWIENLLDRAYGDSSRRKRAWVVVNPHAGPGGADKIWRKQVKPIFDAARMPMTVVRTSYSGEAVKLAKDLNINDFDIAVPCSGDGLPHEVFNGLGQRPDARRALSKIAVCHIPCGSGNAMSCNLYGTHRPTLAALAIVKGLPTPLDLISVTQGNRRTISFLSQALGMIADLDITTEHLRWMGPHRFTYGFLVLAMQKKVYPCDIAIKAEIEHKDGVKEHYRKRVTQGPQLSPQLGNGDGESDQGLPPLKYGTATDSLPEGWELVSHEKLGSFYCGNMAYMAPDTNFFAAALANDGLMDLVMTDGDISIMKNIGLQLSMDSGHFFDSPLVTYRKVSAYRIIPRVQDAKCCISIDGEAFPWEPFQAEVHRGLGLTLSKKGLYEAPGPLNWDKVTTTERLVA